MKSCFALLFCLLCGAWSAAQAPAGKPDPPSAMCPAHEMVQLPDATHDHDAMNHRGEQGMGFSQTETTHHFLLTANGGAIQVEANNPGDAASRDNVKMHLRHIEHAFQNGDFAIPMFVHDTEPPGVLVMKSHAKNIRYSIEETPNGGRVVLQTDDKDALAAIHQFLQFQIREHKTGDPLN
jgi:hypothetical protein